MIIALIILAVLVLAFVGVYNGLIQSRNRVDEAWSDIEVQLKRRYDLIPNLVNTVKGYATHEDSVFTKVSEARSRAMGATAPADKLAAENQLTQTIKSLFAVAEAYPELKANQNFLDLQSNLTDTEDKIQAARRFFNGNVRDYNTKLQTFPTNLFASMFGFSAKTFFDDANKDIQSPVNVQF